MVTVRVLGPLELCDERQEPVVLGSTLRCRLLGALVLHRGAVVTPEILAELVWPEGDEPANITNAVQTHVARLRRVLPGTVHLATEGRGYRLRVAADELDASRFADLVAAAEHAPDPQRRSALLAEALDLWRGAPYADLDHPAAVAEATRLTEARLDAVERRAQAMWEAGGATDAIALLRALVDEAPLREAPVALLMRYLVAVGRQSEALRAYGRLRESLRDELGIMPSPALRAVEAQILAQELPDAPGGGGSRVPAPPPSGRVGLPTSSFLGRHDELGEVAELLRTARVVTIHGPGGVGKTRLARHGAAAVADRYPDGVVFVDLSSVRRPDGVAEAVAVALHVELRGDQDLVRHLREVLAAGRRLVVLDCCEHVVDAVAAWAEDVVAATEGTDVLATSREPLRVDGEHLVRLGPLAPDGAVQLFVDRMRAAGAPAPGSEDLVAIAELCEGLDRLPLAVELAAARTPSIGLTGLVAGLDRRFELLRGGRRTAADHHRGLRDVVEWSYDLLLPDEREVFRRLSVFAGPVGLEDAVAVVAGDGVSDASVRATIPDLAERSLVVRVPTSGGTAYRLLDTLRAFGREALGGDDGALRDRYLAWSLDFAVQAAAGLRGSDEHRWAQRIDLHLLDLLQANRWMAETGHVAGRMALAAMLGRHAVYRYRLDVAHLIQVTIDECGDVVDRNTADVLGCGGTIAWQRGRFDEAEALAHRALGIAAACEDPLAARYGHDVLANLALFRGDTERALAEAATVVELSVAAGDPALQLSGMVDLLLASTYAGDSAAADEVERRVVAVAEQIGTPLWRGWCAYLMGERRATTDPGAAVRHLEDAIALAESTDARFLAGVARHTLVTTAARRADAPVAVASFLPLIDHWHRTGAWNQLWVAVRGLVDALARLGWHREAAQLLGAHEASARAPAPFGQDAELLAAVRRALAAGLGDALGPALDEGAALGDDGAVALAFEVIRASADVPPT